MFERRVLFASALASVLMTAVTLAQQAPSAATRMNELGPENSQMAQRAGIWDVVETVWESSGAAPTSNKYVAERKMIGAFLQEIITASTGLGCT
jgi:hypothetical protein